MTRDPAHHGERAAGSVGLHALNTNSDIPPALGTSIPREAIALQLENPGALLKNWRLTCHVNPGVGA
jgi:hypothetical protein